MRVQVDRANQIALNVVDVTAPVNSDPLFKNQFAHKTLVHSLLLHICITTDSKPNATVASLGRLTLASTQDGELWTIPLDVMLACFPQVNIPAATIGPADDITEFWIPVPFTMFKGIRGKDSYLVSEKCNDYYLTLTGAAENGVTYLSYVCRIILIGEQNNYVAVPTDGSLKFQTDALAGSGEWYDTKLNIIGASWICLVKSDGADFLATDQLKLTLDGKTIQYFNSILDASFVYDHINQCEHNGLLGAFVNDPAVITLPISLDKKMAKTSRSSQFIISILTAAPYTVCAFYQRIRQPSPDEVQKLIQRQNRNVHDADPKILRVGVDSTGKRNAFVKGLYQKIYRYGADGTPEKLLNNV
jgi:hypothetical protein